MSAADIDAEFMPTDDLPVTPGDDLDAAEASALEDPLDLEADEEAPEPFGRTWLFDWEVGRFVRRGLSPVEVTGRQALQQWCLVAANTAWQGHAVFSDEFGVERPDSPLGLVGAEAITEASDWATRLREAWMVHERIVDVDGLEVELIDDAIYVGPFVVVTDEDDQVPVGPLTINGGA